MTKKPTKAQRLATIEESRTLLALIMPKYREAFLTKAEPVMAQYLKDGAVDVNKLDKETRTWAIGQFGSWRGNTLAPHTRRFWELMMGRDDPPPSQLGPKAVKPVTVTSGPVADAKPLKLVFMKDHEKLLREIAPADLYVRDGDSVSETIWWYWLGEWRRAVSRGVSIAMAPRALERFVRLQKVMLQQNHLPELEADLVVTLLRYHGEESLTA